ncbi:acyl-CoA reductase [Streptomyces demainii]|uniref:long-chain-fatty-acyl-CoA reductase n=1 Tax=Streptomyces demainii TaxID=588122 RepID=A0ABT9L6X9_9ACTN|nr:acyl-CoA reductase [Streptomyces demainii]MDP9616473.1 hypothetical protein [Streptomyces demainii]
MTTTNTVRAITPYYWQGAWVDEAETERRLNDIGRIEPELPQPLEVSNVLAACGRLASLLADRTSSERAMLRDDLMDPLTTGLPATEADVALAGLARALDPASLSTQLVAELGTVNPAEPVPVPGVAGAMELWQPMGTLVHVAPSNVAVAGVLSAVEGLLAGNLNVVKTSSSESLFTHRALALLAAADPSGQIRDRVIVLRFSSHDPDWLRLLCRLADAVTVWGTEEAVAGVTRHVPPGCPVIEWGPKISLAYLDRTAAVTPPRLRGLACDILRNGQRSCTSPQIVYADTSDEHCLFNAADALAAALAEESVVIPALAPSTAEQAEITNIVTVARLEEHMGLTRTVSASDGRWHVLADIRAGVSVSPLFGTVWVKPLPREDIVRVLHPMRRYLQTVGLAAAPDQSLPLSRAFFRAGALRITSLGGMLDSYPGEPHDGRSALRSYSRRVVIRST